MSAVLNLAEIIKERVHDSHGDVVNAFFDYLDSHIQKGINAAKDCSYAAVLGYYIEGKIMMHHLRKRLCDLDLREGGYANTTLRIQKTEGNLKTLRDGMYQNVCLECPSCRSRSARWPANTIFA